MQRDPPEKPGRYRHAERDDRLSNVAMALAVALQVRAAKAAATTRQQQRTHASSPWQSVSGVRVGWVDAGWEVEVEVGGGDAGDDFDGDEDDDWWEGDDWEDEGEEGEDHRHLLERCFLGDAGPWDRIHGRATTGRTRARTVRFMKADERRQQRQVVVAGGRGGELLAGSAL